MATLQKRIDEQADLESDLTISITRRIAERMKLVNEDLLYDILEVVRFYTASDPDLDESGSSDFNAVFSAYEKSYLNSLTTGDHVVEVEESSCMCHMTGVVYISNNPGPSLGSTCVRWDNQMGTGVTHGTRRICDVNQMTTIVIKAATREMIRDLRAAKYPGQSDDQILHDILRKSMRRAADKLEEQVEKGTT